MGFKVGYDCDGVLAVQPQNSPIPWRKMNGEQRNKYKRWLVEWYRNAPVIFTPPEDEFVVITARKCTDEIREITIEWLKKNFPGKKFNLEMLQESRNIENVVLFKHGIIAKYNLKDYTEDNRQVVTALRKIVSKTRIWHFKNGRQILDYDAPF